MHFCRFFFSALKEEQPPRTNERNFQTVIYFIRQMRCVSPLAVLTQTVLSLSHIITQNMNMSYRGRTLVVNNLVASSLWHRLACVDPPKQLLAKIQAVLVDFFWDKLHWIQQSVLFLPKEEGGQGLMNLQSRTAAFRLQFLQRFFDGASDVSWRAVACAILQQFGGFGLDKHLILMNPLKMDFSKMPYFYRNLFKVWSLFHIEKTESTYSLHWLLEEPWSTLGYNEQWKLTGV